jgi:hypothetical protein
MVDEVGGICHKWDICYDNELEMNININETKYICLIVLAPDLMTKIDKKAAQDFFCTVSKVFDRVKTVALWSAKKI